MEVAYGIGWVSDVKGTEAGRRKCGEPDHCPRSYLYNSKPSS